MKKLYLSLAILLCVFSFNRVAYPWGAAGSDGGNYQALQETAVFFNNSGGTLTAGDAVIIDHSLSGVATDTTLGAYVRLSDGNILGVGKADAILAVGIVKATASNQRPVVVVTKGPALGTICDSTDAVSNVTAVGTAGSTCTAGQIGGGTNLGISLETGSGSDGDQVIIWVDPTGAD